MTRTLPAPRLFRLSALALMMSGLVACAEPVTFTGTPGEGVTIFSTGDRDAASGPAVGVNETLWRASLDTLSFMPIRSTDPFGGTILTDWYQLPDNPDERVRMNVRLSGRELNANAIRINTFRQARDDGGEWQDQETRPGTSQDLETAILRRAREMHVQRQ